MSDSALNDIAAENAALGSLLVRPEAAAEVFAIAQPIDFFGRNMELATLLASMMDDGITTWDPEVVFAEARRRGYDKVADPVYLVTLTERAWNPLSAAYYAKDVARSAARRALHEIGVRAVQSAASFEADLSLATMELMTAAERLTTKLQAGDAAAPAPNVEDLLLGEVTYNWLVRGLLERGDRMIFTGYEGLGKSVWMRQFAVCLAAGLHPFREESIPPCKVLYIDLENQWTQLRRAYRPLVEVAKRHSRRWDPDRLRVEVRPSGIDVNEPVDWTWLLERVTTHRPDLLAIGPLYRMHVLSLDKEEAARSVVGALDRCRAVSNCAVLVEAHSPHGENGQRHVRPAGSSLFLRWPEFGYGMKPAEKFQRDKVRMVAWRGDRDVRDWPTRLRHGVAGQTMPWIADWQAMEDELRSATPKGGR